MSCDSCCTITVLQTCVIGNKRQIGNCYVILDKPAFAHCDNVYCVLHSSYTMNLICFNSRHALFRADNQWIINSTCGIVIGHKPIESSNFENTPRADWLLLLTYSSLPEKNYKVASPREFQHGRH